MSMEDRKSTQLFLHSLISWQCLMHLMEKLKKLKYELNKRQGAAELRKQYRQQKQKRKRKHREVICHKCKQLGHYASRCGNIPLPIPPLNSETEGAVSPYQHQVCDSNRGSPNSDVCTTAINRLDLIIVNALTSKGILGLNFLGANNCVLDLARGELCCSGTQISLHAKQLQDSTTAHVDFIILTIAAASEIEIIGKAPLSCEGICIVEDNPVKKQLVLVARAIVLPTNGHVPIHIINLDCRPTTIYKGTKVASAVA